MRDIAFSALEYIRSGDLPGSIDKDCHRIGDCSPLTTQTA